MSRYYLSIEGFDWDNGELKYRTYCAYCTSELKCKVLKEEIESLPVKYTSIAIYGIFPVHYDEPGEIYWSELFGIDNGAIAPETVLINKGE